jgi:nicotinamide-nucleotide amidase
MEKVEKARDIRELVDKAGALLVKKKNTIAVAESVTSGNIQAAFSLARDATTFFQGGITAYNIGQKCRHLLVEPTHAIECNCVSKKISDQMALEVCRLFSADYGIGITGYASPVPEQNIHKLFAHLSIAKNNRVVLSKKIPAENSEPAEVQLFYARNTIKMLISILNR